MAPDDVQRANRLITAHHRHHRHGAVAASQQISRANRQFLRRLVRVSEINFAPVKDGCTGDKLMRKRHRIAPPQGFETGLVRPANSGELDQIAVGKRNGYDRVREQVQPAVHDGVKGRLRVCRIQDRVMKAGAVCCLAKPFNRNEFLNCIRSALRGRESGEQPS
jgi:hypothetical protein